MASLENRGLDRVLGHQALVAFQVTPTPAPLDGNFPSTDGTDGNFLSTDRTDGNFLLTFSKIAADVGTAAIR